jgi:chromosome partitioning protein
MMTRLQDDGIMALGKLILVTKLKGGSGATTTCRELAMAALKAGCTVALIDLDGQGGLSRWWNRRTAPAADGDVQRPAPDLLQLTAAQIPVAAKELRQRYDLVVIDSPPSVDETIRAVAAASDLALIPSRPTVDDLDAVGPIARLLYGVVDHAFVLTQVPAVRGSRDGAEALQRLAERAPVLGRTTFRSDYSRPPGYGATGFEEGAAARQEITELYVRVAERLGITSSHENSIRPSHDNGMKSSRDSSVRSSRHKSKEGAGA